jgi:WD40 repeat protein
MATSPWAPLVAITGQKQVLLYHTETLELMGIVPFGEGSPSDVKFSRNGKLLVIGGGVPGKSGRVVLWNIETSERITVIGDEYDTALAADLSPDQSKVALGGPGRLVKIYSTKTGELLHKIKKHTDWVTALAFSPDGEKLASADRNGGISIWDSDNAQELFALAGHKSCVASVHWRNDGKVLASASEDGTAKLWEMTEGKQAKTWTPHTSGVLGFHWAMDGKFASCGRDGQVAIWDANGAKTKSTAITNDLPVRAVLSHDSQRVIAADWLGNVTVFSSKDAKPVGTLSLNPPALSLQISKAEKELADAKTKSNDTTAIEARLARLSSAKIYGEMQRLRDELLAHQAERDKAAPNDKRIADKLTAEITAKEKKLETLKSKLPAKL